MALTFTYDAESPTGTRETIRVMIGDTDSGNPIFYDEEMDLTGIVSSDLNTWAGNLMMAIASTQAKIAVKCMIAGRDFDIDRKAVAKECRDQAMAFYKLASDIPYATEGMVEDEEQTFIKGTQDSEYDFDLEDTDLNT